MASRIVPVHMGSPRFDVLELEGFRITDAWFPPGEVLPFHTHDRAIFATMLQGSFEDVFRSRSYDCTPATVFTEPAGEGHANHIERAGARVLVVQPDPDFEELHHPGRGLFERIHNFRDGEIASLAARLAGEIRAPDDVAPVAAEAFVLEMVSRGARLEAREGNDPPVWLERAQEMIHAHFRDRLRIADLAEEVDVHPVHLSRVFRAHLHEPVGTYIRHLRLEWAAGELAEGDPSLSTLALRAGFSDQSHFTRAFKRYTGYTPGRYRELRAS